MTGGWLRALGWFLGEFVRAHILTFTGAQLLDDRASVRAIRPRLTLRRQVIDVLYEYLRYHLTLLVSDMVRGRLSLGRCHDEEASKEGADPVND